MSEHHFENVLQNFKNVFAKILIRIYLKRNYKLYIYDVLISAIYTAFVFNFNFLITVLYSDFFNKIFLFVHDKLKTPFIFFSKSL